MGNFVSNFFFNHPTFFQPRPPFIAIYCCFCLTNFLVNHFHTSHIKRGITRWYKNKQNDDGLQNQGQNANESGLQMQTPCFPSVTQSSRARPGGFPRRAKGPTWTVPTGQRAGCFAWTWFMRPHLFLGTSFFGPEEIWAQLFSREKWLRPLTKCQNMWDDFKSSLVYIKKKKKKKTKSLKCWEDTWGSLEWEISLRGGCLPLNCRRLLLEGSSWVEQRGSSCLS